MSSGNYSRDTADDLVLCDCNIPAVQRQVKKECANKGRWFWCCPKSQGQGCKFFQFFKALPRKRHDKPSDQPQGIASSTSDDEAEEEPVEKKQKTHAHASHAQDSSRDFAIKLLEERLVKGEKGMKEIRDSIDKLHNIMEKFIAAQFPEAVSGEDS